MKCLCPTRFRLPARVNVKLLVTLVLGACLVGVGAFVGHRVRKGIIADRALAAGQSAVQQRDWEEASVQLRQYLSKFPDDIEILEEYAQASLKVQPPRAETIGAAIGAYRRVLRHRPGDARICARLAKLYYGIRDYNEAAYVCRQRLEVEPSDSEALLLLGEALIAQHKHEEAAEILTHLVAQAPQEVTAYALLSTVAMKDATVLAIESARSWLDQAVENNPRSAQAWLQRARFHRLSDDDRSVTLADLETAHNLPTDDPNVLLVLLEEWMAWGRADRVQAVLEAIEDHLAERASDLEQVEGFEIDSRRVELALAMARGWIALTNNAKEEGVAFARQTVEQLGERELITFVPLAVELYLAADRIEEARSAVERFGALIEPSLTDRPELGERFALLQASLADAEDKPYQVIALLQDFAADLPPTSENWEVMLWQAYKRTGRERLARDTGEAYALRGGRNAEVLQALARAYRGRQWTKVLRYAGWAAQQDGADNLEALLLTLEARIVLIPRGAALGDKFDEIAAELEALRELHPRAGAIRIVQAAVAARRGNLDEALRALERALTECDPDADLEWELASLYGQMGRDKEQMDRLRTAMVRHPDSAPVRLTLARLQDSAGQSDEARQTLSRAVEELSGQAKADATYAFARFFLNHDEPAECANLLEDLAARRPRDARPRLALLELVVIQEDATRAQSLIDEIKAIEGERSGLNWRVEQARLWLRADDAKQHRNDIEELLTFCIRMDPGSPEPVLALGRLYETIGNVDRAERVYRRMVDRDPSQVAVVSRLLAVYEAQRRFDEANDVLARMPVNLPALSAHRVNVAIGLGEYVPAKEELERRIAADADDALARVILASLRYAHEHDVEGALELLIEARTVQPDLASASVAEVNILRDEGRRDEAVALLNAEVKRRNDFDAYLMRAAYYASVDQLDRLSRFALAEKDFVRLTTFGDSAAQGYAHLGRFYQGRGLAEKAIAAWEAGLNVAPGADDLRRLLAEALIEQSTPVERERGKALLSALLTSKPDDTELLLVQARALMREQTSATDTDAMALLERVIGIDPHSEAAYALLIELTANRDGPGAAVSVAARALGSNPDSPRLRLMRATLERRLGNVRAARELAQSLLAEDSSNVGARTLLAELHLQAGTLAAGEELVAQALELDPSHEGAHLLEAKFLEARGRGDQAIEVLEAYRRTPASWPTSAGSNRVDTLLTLAHLHQTRGDSDTAWKRLVEADALAPGDKDVALVRLSLFAADGRFDDLVAELDHRRTDDPNDQRVLLVGASLLSTAEAEPYLGIARKVYERVIAADADRIEAYLGLADAAHRSGETETARKAYRRVLELNAYNLQAMNNLAWLLGTEADSADEALELANKGVLRFPNDAHLLDTRGGLLLRLGRFADAARDFERCLAVTAGVPSLRATRARALMHLGRVRVQQGYHDQATKRFDEALRIDREEQVFSDEERRDMERLLLQPSAQR